MKESRLNYLIISAILICAVFFSSCATLLGGGSTYNAHVVVNKNHPNAEILYQGKTRGYGTATFKAVRGESNNFSFTVREPGYPEQTYDYKYRTFRTGAFLGTVAVWTGIGIATTGVAAVCGPIIDFATGSIWKPNIIEPGVSQESLRTFRYLVDYDSVSSGTEVDASKYTDVVYLKNGNVFRGNIFEKTPNVGVKMQTKDGNKLTFLYRDIARITKESSSEASKYQEKTEPKPEPVISQPVVKEPVVKEEKVKKTPVVEEPIPVTATPPAPIVTTPAKATPVPVPVVKEPVRAAKVVTQAPVTEPKPIKDEENVGAVTQEPAAVVQKPRTVTRKARTVVRKPGTAGQKQVSAEKKVGIVVTP